MIGKIIFFFNNNPLIGTLIILTTMIVLIYFTQNKCNKLEYMDSMSCNINTDNTFNAYFKNVKLINFKCTINGKEYYLANIKNGPVQKYLENNCLQSEKIDCTDSIMVLIEKEKIEKSLFNYLTSINNYSDKCIKNKCESVTMSECIPPLNCLPDRQFYHDFMLFDVSQKNSSTPTQRKYVIIGTSEPNEEGRNHRTTLNQHLYNDKNIRYLCGDYMQHKDPDINGTNNYMEIVVVESPVNDAGGIIYGIGEKIKIKLKFNSEFLLETFSSDGAKKYIKKIGPDGKPVSVPSYVGYCASNICPVGASIGSIPYLRVCMYSDALDKNVLEFEPIMV